MPFLKHLIWEFRQNILLCLKGGRVEAPKPKMQPAWPFVPPNTTPAAAPTSSTTALFAPHATPPPQAAVPWLLSLQQQLQVLGVVHATAVVRNHAQPPYRLRAILYIAHANCDIAHAIFYVARAIAPPKSFSVLPIRAMQPRLSQYATHSFWKLTPVKHG